MTTRPAFPTDDKLILLACPTPEDVPFFNHCMSLAKDMAMTWDQALVYVIEQRQGGKPVDVSPIATS